PTPAGVPVAITSPDCNGRNEDAYDTISATPNSMSEVLPFCRTTPLTVRLTARLATSPTSSGVTIQGPNAPVPTKFLPEVTWLEWNCQSRMLPSLKHEYP